MRLRLAALAAALLCAGVLSACDADVAPPGDPDVRVDTPALRELKREIGMEPCRPGDAEPVDGGLPEVSLPCLGGGEDVDLSTLRGPLVVNLWQAFCGPCKKEMPALQAFHERYGDRVGVLGVDYQDVNPEAALGLARRTGATYPSVADPAGELQGQDSIGVIRGMPTFVLVDAEGRVASVLPGGVDSVADIKEMVAEHLGVQL
ncbi:hypothetical protein DDE18_13095 [Nocardioides gansuensis]|uniref:Thioredoxin domain-containing protein n=1 Tax=Nocardioides gansuensis TaxID=2138300 RepID=A0A2T8F9N5_9ACTN|nr:TlpA disulfide reductase family protein [Nocardioides gansuensis]PVG82399.1 hypothetical protein DDE18_13095 [Nocardioides gansuensis]